MFLIHEHSVIKKYSAHVRQQISYFGNISAFSLIKFYCHRPEIETTNLTDVDYIKSHCQHFKIRSHKKKIALGIWSDTIGQGGPVMNRIGFLDSVELKKTYTMGKTGACLSKRILEETLGNTNVQRGIQRICAWFWIIFFQAAWECMTYIIFYVLSRRRGKCFEGVSGL